MAGVCWVSDRTRVPAGDLPAAAARLAEAGVTRIQVREKDLEAGELVALTRRVVELTRSRCEVVVNGRLDIALASGADGVHLPVRGVPIAAARRVTPRGFRIGASAHSVEEAAQAAREGADYVFLGPVYPTPSKLRYGAPIGLDPLRRAVSGQTIPVWAIGGITTDNVESVHATGVAGVAVISALADLKEPEARIAALGAGRA